MIKNDKQLAVTKKNKAEFLNTIKQIEQSNESEILKEIMKDSILSQIEDFNIEIQEYENLKSQQPKILYSEFDKIPESLIKARIAKGLSQKQLSEILGVKEQQVQRDESSNYESASYGRIMQVAKGLNIEFEQTKLSFGSKIELKEYDNSFVQRATEKLQKRKCLLETA